MSERILAESQALIWRLVTAPEGVAQGLALANDPEGRALSAFLRRDDRLDAAARLSIYANAYFYRIRDALREDFAALYAAIGERAFHNLVTSYLIAHAPTHPSLRYAGKNLPAFLATNPDSAMFRARWPFAADLAALEWALLEAFDAPDAQPITRGDLAAVPTEDWASLRFSLTPTLQILSLGWPVHKARELHDRGDDPAAGALAPEVARLRVWRNSERVFYRPMSPAEHSALETARAGGAFGDICVGIAADAGEAAAAGRALAILERWLADALLTGI
ncbi:MAG: putative DNA-binding domain-containing protein, partial [Myxococcota bacterium]